MSKGTHILFWVVFAFSITLFIAANAFDNFFFPLATASIGGVLAGYFILLEMR